MKKIKAKIKRGDYVVVDGIRYNFNDIEDIRLIEEDECDPCIAGMAMMAGERGKLLSKKLKPTKKIEKLYTRCHRDDEGMYRIAMQTRVKINQIIDYLMERK